MKHDLKTLARTISLGPDGQPTNLAAVVSMLKRDGLSDYLARTLAARAVAEAQGRPSADLDEQRQVGPGEAAAEFGIAASSIRRAAALGYIAGATRGKTGRWSFTVGAFKSWAAGPRRRPDRASR